MFRRQTFFAQYVFKETKPLVFLWYYLLLTEKSYCNCCYSNTNNNVLNRCSKWREWLKDNANAKAGSAAN